MTRIHAVVLSCLLGVFAAGPLSAQESEDPSANARFHVGPVRLSPAFTFVGPGIDTNVFNEIDNPKRDTTARFAPSSEWWLRTGPGMLALNTQVEYQHFVKYASQRSWNTQDSGRYSLKFGRVTPFVFGSYANTRARPNYEIVTRIRHTEDAVGVGTELRVLSKTSVVASASRTRLRYARNDDVYGASLSDALDRKTESVRVDLRQRLSSLTTFVVRAEHQQDRFDYSPFRDADSVRVTPGFEFKPFALISGNAFVGYRSFRPLDPRVPDFKGLVASLDLAYALPSTRFSARFSRDVVYSFEPTQPYYLLDDVTVGVTQMITGSFDVALNVGRQNLGYQELITPGVTSEFGQRNDKALHAGGGFGYWLGHTLRIGLDVDLYKRDSTFYADRNFRSWQAGLSVKYGLKP